VGIIAPFLRKGKRRRRNEKGGLMQKSLLFQRSPLDYLWSLTRKFCFPVPYFFWLSLSSSARVLISVKF